MWNLENGKQIGEEWRDGKGQVHSIASSPDGTSKIVSGSDDGVVRLWDIDTGKDGWGTQRQWFLSTGVKMVGEC